MTTIRSIPILFAIIACGGGGGGNGTPTSPSNPGPGPGPGSPSGASVDIRSVGDGYGGLVHSFNPSSVTITRGAAVTWTNGSGEVHNVTFAGGTGAPANIGDHSSGSNSRTFSSSGTFNYQCTIHAITGQVVVQ